MREQGRAGGLKAVEAGEPYPIKISAVKTLSLVPLDLS